MISLVLSESIGSGHGSGSQLPVATTVTFIFFILGPLVKFLVGVAISEDTLVTEGS